MLTTKGREVEIDLLPGNADCMVSVTIKLTSPTEMFDIWRAAESAERRRLRVKELSEEQAGAIRTESMIRHMFVRSSGLTAADIRQLGLLYLDDAQVAECGDDDQLATADHALFLFRESYDFRTAANGWIEVAKIQSAEESLRKKRSAAVSTTGATAGSAATTNG